MTDFLEKAKLSSGLDAISQALIDIALSLRILAGRTPNPEPTPEPVTSEPRQLLVVATHHQQYTDWCKGREYDPTNKYLKPVFNMKDVHGHATSVGYVVLPCLEEDRRQFMDEMAAYLRIFGAEILED